MVYEPGSVCVHNYEFGRHPRKTYLLERNRLITWLTVPSGRTLFRLAVPLAVTQCMLVAYAVTRRDALAWLKAWSWVLRHPGTLRSRRRRIQQGRRVSDEAWIRLAEPELQPHDPAGVRVPAAVNALLRRGHAWFMRGQTPLDRRAEDPSVLGLPAPRPPAL